MRAYICDRCFNHSCYIVNMREVHPRPPFPPNYCMYSGLDVEWGEVDTLQIIKELLENYKDTPIVWNANKKEVLNHVNKAITAVKRGEDEGVRVGLLWRMPDAEK